MHSIIRVAPPVSIKREAADEKSRLVTVTCSTEELGRDDMIIKTDGIDLKAYRTNPVWLWQHNPEWPIARAEQIDVQDNKLVARVRFPDEGVSSHADEVYRLIKAGIVNAASIGFSVLDADPINPKEPFGTWQVNASELYEVSFVSVPALREALISERSAIDKLKRSWLKREPEDWTVGADRDLSLDDSTEEWDADAAVAGVFAWAGGDEFDSTKARRAFLIYDAGNPSVRASYKLPFARVSAGDLKAVLAGVNAAASRLPQTDAPQDVLDRARAVIEHYQQLANPPGEGGQQQQMAKLATQRARAQRVSRALGDVPMALTPFGKATRPRVGTENRKMGDRIPELMRDRATAATVVQEARRVRDELLEREVSLPPGKELAKSDQAALASAETALRASLAAMDAITVRLAQAEALRASQEAAAQPIAAALAASAPSFATSAVETRLAAALRTGPDYDHDPSVALGGAIRFLARARGNIFFARQMFAESGESGNEWIARALNATGGGTGTYVIPPGYQATLIELLRAKSVVRAAGPMVLPMENGRLRLPRQSEAASAHYGAEGTDIAASQPGFGELIAQAHKLTAIVPLSNDFIRRSDPAGDAIVRNDLVLTMALTEDQAFLRGDGSNDSPTGFASFAQPDATFAATPDYTLQTVVPELAVLRNAIEMANVPMTNLAWFMSPRSKNYLLNAQDKNWRPVQWLQPGGGPDGSIIGIPVYATTQIPVNLSDGTNSDCSEIYLAAMNQAIVCDTLTIQLATSQEAAYMDADAKIVAAYSRDQTVLRAISEHDFVVRHSQAVAKLTGVRWAPSPVV